MYDLYAQLDIKHILHDTLSWLIIPPCLEWGALAKVKGVAENLLRLNRDNARDSPEYVFFSVFPRECVFDTPSCVSSWVCVCLRESV